MLEGRFKQAEGAHLGLHASRVSLYVLACALVEKTGAHSAGWPHWLLVHGGRSRKRDRTGGGSQHTSADLWSGVHHAPKVAVGGESQGGGCDCNPPTLLIVLSGELF